MTHKNSCQGLNDEVLPFTPALTGVTLHPVLQKRDLLYPAQGLVKTKLSSKSPPWEGCALCNACSALSDILSSSHQEFKAAGGKPSNPPSTPGPHSSTKCFQLWAGIPCLRIHPISRMTEKEAITQQLCRNLVLLLLCHFCTHDSDAWP